MRTLAEVIRDADQLSDEDQVRLATHLLSQMKRAPLGSDDDEVARRKAQIDTGTAEMISHDELIRAVGR